MGYTYAEFKTYEKSNQPTYNAVSVTDKLKLQVKYKGMTKDLFAEEIVAMILTNLKLRVDQTLDTNISHAVITVPSHFDSRQRQAVLHAGEIAGLNLRLVNDSTVLALKYCLGKKFDTQKNVLIFISGGGSTEVSIATIKNNECEIIASNGSNNLGGVEIDKKIVNCCIDYFRKEERVDLTSTKQKFEEIKMQQRIMQRLLLEAEKAKVILSTTPVASIEISYGKKDLKMSLSRTK